MLNGLKVKDLIGEEIKNHPFEDVYSEDCYIADTQSVFLDRFAYLRATVYWRCISKVQCVHSGADAMDLLLRSNRILEDISRGMRPDWTIYSLR